MHVLELEVPLEREPVDRPDQSQRAAGLRAQQRAARKAEALEGCSQVAACRGQPIQPDRADDAKLFARIANREPGDVDPIIRELEPSLDRLVALARERKLDASPRQLELAFDLRAAGATDKSEVERQQARGGSKSGIRPRMRHFPSLPAAATARAR